MLVNELHQLQANYNDKVAILQAQLSGSISARKEFCNMGNLVFESDPNTAEMYWKSAYSLPSCEDSKGQLECEVKIRLPKEVLTSIDTLGSVSLVNKHIPKPVVPISSPVSTTIPSLPHTKPTTLLAPSVSSPSISPPVPANIPSSAAHNITTPSNSMKQANTTPLSSPTPTPDSPTPKPALTTLQTALKVETMVDTIQLEALLASADASDGSYDEALLEMIKSIAFAIQQCSFLPNVDCVVLGLTELGTKSVSCCPPSFLMCRGIFNLLGHIFNKSILVNTVSEGPLHKLFTLLTKILLDVQSFEMQPDEREWMNKAADQLLVSSLDNCDTSSVLIALVLLVVRVHIHAQRVGENEQFTSMLALSMLRVLPRLRSFAFSDWSRIVQLLKEADNFLIACSSAKYITLTINSMLDELALKMGPAILNHLETFTKSAPVVLYLQNYFKSNTVKKAQTALIKYV
eukprot:Phypoly_transcript_06231.p1 GENE.Phypoly_transcript_06231~~Phypoly_transcript_06231.p1  ORF type:complete len:461 (+),score=61.81 Phypoly_transcript_06231:370-1752(+)